MVLPFGQRSAQALVHAPPPPVEVNAPPKTIRDLYDLLDLIYGPGKRTPKIIRVTLTAGGVFEAVSATPLRVLSVSIQNISTEDVTVVTDPTGTAGEGIRLNAATTSTKAGGSQTWNNIDLNKLYFTRTTNGLTLAVQYEQ